jgi:hypothetical protein
MATITAANVSALMSSLAKHITDLQAQIGSGSAITAGEATTLGKIAALADASQEYALMAGFQTALATNEAAYLTKLASVNPIYDLFAPACIALERATGGLNAFLTTNAIKAPTAYANAHNRCASLTGAVVTIVSGNIDGTIVPAY